LPILVKPQPRRKLKKRDHLRGEVCCCKACYKAFEHLWFAAEGGCPEGLVRKQIIDRLGRKQNRCVRRDEDTGEDAAAKSEENFDKLISVGREERRASFAADVLGVELTEEQKSGDGWKEFVNQQKAEMGAEAVASEEVKRHITAWVDSSIQGDSDNIQMAMATVYDVPEEELFRYFEGIDAVNDQLRAQGQPVYRDRLPFNEPDEEAVTDFAAELKLSMDKEQAFWEDKLGPDGTISMYRGMNLPEGSIELGENVVQDFPASSWSSDPGVAVKFGETIVKREVGAKEIIMSFFSLIEETEDQEHEFVLYTPEEGATVEVLVTK